MYKLLLYAFLLCSLLSAQAQNKGIVKGKLTDSLNNAPLELATVSVVMLKDTTSELVSYTASDVKGLFALHNLPVGKQLRILISFVSYKPFRKQFTLQKGETLDLGTIALAPRQLNEISIKGERSPILFKKDTIEFAAEAFKVRPNAVVEELLKKLPGFEIQNNGDIMVNGREVRKILVDGRNFFAGDIRIASKNLDAEMVDKIQVYDDRENDPDHLIPDYRVKSIINLKFKKKLIKSVFGKVYGGAGTRSRYESGGLFNLFRDTLQVSLLGLSNNMGSTGFSFDDLYNNGGLNRGGIGSGFSSAGLAGMGRVANGIQQNTLGGANINDDINKKIKMNLAYTYGHNVNDQNTLNTRDQFTQDTDFTTSYLTSRNRVDNKHDVNFTLKIQPNDGTQLTYNPKLTYSDNRSASESSSNSFTNFVPQVNKSVNSDNGTGNTLQFGQTFNFNKQLKKKGSSINIDHSFSYNPDNSDGYSKNALVSYITTFPSYTLDRYNGNRNKIVWVNLGAGYRYPLSKKIVGSLTVSGDYNHNVNNTATYDFNPATNQYDVYLLPLSTDLTRNLWVEHLSAGITYAITPKMNMVINVTGQYQQVNNKFARGLPDLDQNYFNLLPNVQFSAGAYSFEYSQQVTIPNIGDQVPYSVVFSPLYSVIGNPDLKPTTRHNFGVNFRKNNYQQRSNLTLNASATIEDNTVLRQRTLNSIGAETSKPINMDGQFTTSLRVYYNKGFKKQHDLQFSTTSSASINQRHSLFEINRQDGFQNSYTMSVYQRFSLNWKDLITLDPNININQSFTAYSGVDYKNVNTSYYSFDTPYNIYWPKRTTIAGTYAFTYNPTVVPGFQKSSNLLNVSIARQFLKKDRAEIKLSCYDILDQAISTSRYAFDNIVSTTQSQIINRYFMVTLRWKFNSSTYQEKTKMLLGPLR